ncbi:MAG TPA: S1/P1 nuclease [Pirellulales bacterium]|nr:S1/P1 nuclease [Pirellulales bacterium]
MWIRLVVAGLVVLALAGRATAWNSTGHMAVALLAWKQLDAEQRRAAHQLLKTHPHYRRYLAEARPEGVAEDEWAFLRAATWPDWVRETPEHHASDLKPFHHAPWHYINLPFVAPADAGQFAPADLTPPTPNVVTALNAAFDALLARQENAEDAAIHFCWVLHLAGDIHQPLHCASLVSHRYPPPRGDEGGNRLAITPSKRPESLHTYWDGLLGKNTHYQAIEGIVKRVDAASEHDPELATKLRAHTTVESWSEESFAQAVKFAYLDGQLPTVDYRQVEGGEIPHSEVPVLPADYASTAREVAQRQAALGGWRLAAMVKQITAAK